MAIAARDLGEAIDEIEDLIREMNRVSTCTGFVERAEEVLNFLKLVRGVGRNRVELERLLETR